MLTARPSSPSPSTTSTLSSSSTSTATAYQYSYHSKKPAHQIESSSGGQAYPSALSDQQQQQQQHLQHQHQSAFTMSESGTVPATTILILEPLNGTFATKRLELWDEPIKIGRKVNVKVGSEPNNGIFDSKVLSRTHAEIWQEGGKVWIKDVKSSNGTFVNEVRLSEEGQLSGPHELKTGDLLEFGIDIMHDDNKTMAAAVTVWDPSQGSLPPSPAPPKVDGRPSGAKRPSGFKLETVIGILDSEIKKATDTSADIKQLKSTLDNLDSIVNRGTMLDANGLPINRSNLPNGPPPESVVAAAAGPPPPPSDIVSPSPPAQAPAVVIPLISEGELAALKASLARSEAEVAEIRVQLEAAQRKLQEHQASMVPVVRENEELQRRWKEAVAELVLAKQEGEGVVSSVKGEVEEWKRRAERAEAEAEALKKKEINAIKTSAAATAAQKEHLESLESEIGKLKIENQALREAAESTRAECEVARAETDRLRGEEVSNRKSLVDAVKVSTDLRRSLEGLEAERDALAEQVKASKAALAGAQGTVKVLEGKLAEAEREKDRALAAAQAANSALTAAQQQVKGQGEGESGLRKRKSKAALAAVPAAGFEEGDGKVGVDGGVAGRGAGNVAAGGGGGQHMQNAVQALMYLGCMGIAAVGTYLVLGASGHAHP
ncbi:hypothetical protein HDU76_010410 [Blyttiomyces sp. JEL0837]|nr:hypothetical protein HDU76_010410 [Blyttiomyces sp. JEL0837]